MSNFSFQTAKTGVHDGCHTTGTARNEICQMTFRECKELLYRNRFPQKTKETVSKIIDRTSMLTGVEIWFLKEMNHSLGNWQMWPPSMWRVMSMNRNKTEEVMEMLWLTEQAHLTDKQEMEKVCGR